MAAAVTSGVVALMVQANREAYEVATDPQRGESDSPVHGAAADLGRSTDAGEQAA